MVIFSLQCRTFSYRTVSPTPHAIDLSSAEIDAVQDYDNCLFLLVGVELGDSAARLRPAVKAIRRTIRQTGVKSVVINGFAGLSADPADPEVSAALLQSLRVRVHTLDPDVEVHVMPFGWRKDWTMDAVAGPWSQRCLHLHL
ncbi:threonyl-tRNA synthetase editing domain-containing protein [Nocardia sp. NPDC004604]|uniref:threonyl-tRNA synthetase editing domain-containing protein n=1 Tax=Nocardia sp. NPDC004604 TaxID=3157013 RepID=UPI0033BBF146